jgi:acetyl esterase
MSASSPATLADTIRVLENGTSDPDPRTDVDTQSLIAAYPEFADVAIRNVRIPGSIGDIDVRVYTPRNIPTNTPAGGFIWAHGGSFIGGNLDMPESNWVSLSVASAGFTVVAVEYTKALFGVRFPVPSLDLLAAWDWAITELGLDPRRLHVGGASAGGNLAAGVGVRLRDRGQPPASLLLVYPLLHSTLPAGSPEALAAIATVPDEALFPQSMVSQIALNYVGDEHLLQDPYAFAGYADLAGLPPTLVLNSDRDEHRLSSEAFTQKAILAGVDVHEYCEPGSLHGHLDRPHTPEAQHSILELIGWLRNNER